MDEPRRASDEQLMAEFRSTRQPALFAEIVRRLDGPLHKVVSRYVVGDEVSDVVQETFAKMLAHVGTYRGEYKLSSWVFQIAVNAAADLGRRRKRWPQMVGDENFLPNVAGQAERHAPIAEVRELVSRLPTILRDVVQLVDLREVSYKQAARQLGIPIGAVRSRRHRALQVLREMAVPEAN